MNRFMIAAPRSGSGKTLVTLGLLRAFRNKGMRVAGAKAGPDYIDPAFHSAASGKKCINLDPWAMRKDQITCLYHNIARGSDLIIVEAMMGLFDGAADGSASAGDLAATLDLSVVLVVDVTGLSQSVAALVSGFANFRSDVHVAGVILNQVSSPRHEMMLRTALDKYEIRVFGAIPKDQSLALPARHVGLVQAGEHPELDLFIEHAAHLIEVHCELDGLSGLGGEKLCSASASHLPPLGQRIAVAEDNAFQFTYQHWLDGWSDAGAEILPFSPLILICK